MSAREEIRAAAVEAILARGPKHAAQRILLLELAVAADPATRTTTIAMPQLAAAACVSERYARMICRDLETDGWLQRQIGRGRGRVNTYTVNLDLQLEAQP